MTLQKSKSSSFMITWRLCDRDMLELTDLLLNSHVLYDFESG
jgi:hypothetical protein